MFGRVFNLLILVLASLLVKEAITATTGRTRIVNQPWAASPLLRNTFDEDTDQQQCQCAIFYLCDDVNIVRNATHCDQTEVCCKTDTTISVESSSLESAVVPESSSESSSTSAESAVVNELPLSSTSTELPVKNELPLSPTSTESPIDYKPSPSSTPTTTGDAAECGIRRENGQTTDILFGEFPWMVAILRTSESSTTGNLICGGSLLSPNIVLTAAHCIHNINIDTLRVRAGDFDINGETDERLPHQDRTVNKIVKHQNYSSKILHNDLALIHVNEPFTYEDHIAPVCSPAFDSLYATSDSYDLQNCLVTGWTRNTDNTVENKLKKVSATVITKENCENSLQETRLGRSFKLHPSFLCAKEQESVCKGHGGGPLVCVSRSNPNKYVQVGVVSWGIGCDTNLPGVYASLENNAEWLTTEFNHLNEPANRL